MALPLSQDLRRRLVEAVSQGSSARAAAARFEVSPAAAVRIVRQARETGSTAPGQIGGYRKPLLDATRRCYASWSRAGRVSRWPRSGTS